MLLPIGTYRKTEIRELAHRYGLRVADKRDSQEICFVTSGKHDEFVRARTAAETAGEIVTVEGRVVGRHTGIERFTIGQRKGLGVALGQPQFVVRIEPDTHRVVIGDKADLARRTLLTDQVNWLVDPPDAPFSADVQIRYNSSAWPATVTPLADDRCHVQFDQPRLGIAPGQAAVFYQADRVLGGGWIESAPA